MHIVDQRTSIHYVQLAQHQPLIHSSSPTLSSLQSCVGSMSVKHCVAATHARKGHVKGYGHHGKDHTPISSKTTQVKFPLRTFLSIENANKDVIEAGEMAIMRAIIISVTL